MIIVFALLAGIPRSKFFRLYGILLSFFVFGMLSMKKFESAVICCVCLIIIIFGAMVSGVMILVFLLFPAHETFLTDKVLLAMGKSTYDEAFIGVPQTSKSSLNSGYLEYSKKREHLRPLLPHQSRLDTSDVKQIIAALRPITMIEKSPSLNPSDFDCIFFCWISRDPIFFYIKVTEPQLVIWHKGYLYQGGESKDFIDLINAIWLQHPDANQVQIEICENGITYKKVLPALPLSIASPHPENDDSKVETP